MSSKIFRLVVSQVSEVLRPHQELHIHNCKKSKHILLVLEMSSLNALSEHLLEIHIHGLVVQTC